MSNQKDPLSLKPFVNTREYKDGISEMNRVLMVLRTGFSASVAGMANWDKTASGLELRNKSLADIIDVQRKKVAVLTEEYKKAVEAKGAESKAAENLEIDLNKATAALNASEAELKKNSLALEEDAKGAKKLGQEVQETERKTISFRDVMKGLGSVLAGVGKAIAAVAAAAFAAAGAIAGFVFKFASIGDDLQTMSDKTGLTVEKLQELDYIGKQIGVDGDVIKGALNKTIAGMSGAKDKTSDFAKIYKQLRVDLRDSNGDYKSSQQVMMETIKSLGAMTDETERDMLTQKLFGKSWQEINPLIKTSTAEFERLRQQAHDVGAVMSDDAVKGLAGFNDTLDGLKSGVKGVGGEIAAALLPAFQSTADGAMGWLQSIARAVKLSGGNLGDLAGRLGVILKNMLGELAKNLPGMANVGLSLLKGIIGAIVSNIPVLMPAVIQILQSVVGFISELVPTLVPALMAALIQLIPALLGMLPTILQALLQIIFSISNSLATSLPVLLPAIIQTLLGIVNVLIENIPMLLTAAMQLLMGLAQGLIAAIPLLVEEMPVLVESIVTGIVENLPMLIVASIQILLALLLGLIQNLPLIIQSVPQIINALVEKFKSPEFKAKMNGIGTELVNGLKKGWTDAWESFKANIVEGFNKMVATIKTLLGIASPSKLFAGIGGFMVGGLGTGWAEDFKKVRAQMESDMRGLGAMAGQALGGGGLALAGNTNNSNSESYQFFGPVYLSGEAGRSMGKELKGRSY